MSITRFKQLHGCGVFRDFTWDEDLADFGRYNLIYGWNGSGKTTLSRLFQTLETKSEPSEGTVTVTIGGSDVRNGDFSQVSLGVRVFNCDFIAESVFPTDGDVAPIYVLGKENVEKQKQLEECKATLDKQQAMLSAKQQEKRNADAFLDRHCIGGARVIKEMLRLSGSSAFNNYNKSDFQRRAQEMITADDRQSYELSDEHREMLLAQHHATLKPRVQSITYELPAIKSLEEGVSNLLSTTVVSVAIQSLKDDEQVSSWIHTGLGIHQERQIAKCLYCDQPMPQSRLAQLESHFNAEYEILVKKVDGQIVALQDAVNTARTLSIPNAAQLYDDLSPEFILAADALRNERDSAKVVLEAFMKSLREKKARPFAQTCLDVALPQLNMEAVDRCNNIIEKHNQACDDFQSRGEAARKELEADSIVSNLEEFVKLHDSVQIAEDAVDSISDEVTRLADEIRKLEREVVEHRQPAEDLNRDLCSYLGHGELHLKFTDPGYTIMRHDTPAKSLSEGEMTAIALLYFLKSLQDQTFDLKKGVVVLDDPVSSLDANALYCAFGLIRSRTMDAAQLVILTHNFAFFRQVRNWYHHLKNQGKKDIALRPARFYMLNCKHEQDGRRTKICQLDPLLEEFDSEYHYLFAYIYRAATATPQATLKHAYVLPNLARRLLEAFLAFRQPQVSGELWKKMQVIGFDESKKIRILRFLHTHSHNDALGEPEHDLSLLSEARAVLSDLLTLMKSEDADHFSAMVQLVAPTAGEHD